jgi:hypothetical protein
MGASVFSRSALTIAAVMSAIFTPTSKEKQTKCELALSRMNQGNVD